jgi:hypothetical protein
MHHGMYNEKNSHSKNVNRLNLFHSLQTRFRVKHGMTENTRFRHPELASGSRFCKRYIKKRKEDARRCDGMQSALCNKGSVG